MTDQPPTSDTNAGSGRRPPPGTPRWVKVSAIIAIVLIVLFVALHLMGLGFSGHGMGGGTFLIQYGMQSL
jgi:hypothetical protein